jgi:hypothetical protein
MVETQSVVKFYSKENNQKECRKIIKNCQKKECSQITNGIRFFFKKRTMKKLFILLVIIRD